MNEPGHPPGGAAALPAKTVLGETVWPVLPGRAPGQETGLEHLVWGGAGDAIHLHTGGSADGHMEYPGRDSGTVSGPCNTAAEAQQAAAAYLAGREKELAAAGGAHRLARTGSPATPLDAGDQAARIPGEHGTQEQRLEYVLMEAGRRKSIAYAAAWAQCEAAGETPAAEQRHEVDYEAAHAAWTAEVASAVAGYAREIGATAPDPASGPEDLGSPYHQGWSSGANMLLSDITDRPGGYNDGQWREYVAGYAEGAQSHAEATAALAQAVRERAQQNPVDAASETASSGKQPVKTHGVPSGAPARDESAGPGLGAVTDFPGAPAAWPAAGTGWRPSGSGVTSAGRARPGRPR
jgi:hypothetical protein